MKRIEFPEIKNYIFPREWFKDILKIPEEKEWTKKASLLFFYGSKIEINRLLPDDYIDKGLLTLRCTLISFEPKHEHKEHVAGLILKSLCEK